MWPWLVGAGVLALLTVSSGKGSAPSYTTTAPRGSTPARVVASSNVPLTAANIQKAASVALAHETSVSNLETFGKALYDANYPALGVPLIGKALKQQGHAISVAAILQVLNIYQGSSPVPPGLATEITQWMGGAATVTAPTSNVLGVFTPSSDILFWVNKYAPANYTLGQSASVSDLAKAVKNMIAKAPAVQLTALEKALSTTNQKAYASQLQARVSEIQGYHA